MKRRLLSAFLAVMMVLTMAPVAFAAEGDAGSSTAVAKIGDAGYATLAAAVAAAKNGDTVTLVKDTDQGFTVPAGLSITFDVNGKTLERTGQDIQNNGTLTIRDNTKQGKIIANGGNVGIAIGVGNNSVTTIEYANVEAVEGAVITGQATGATITIEDGVFSTSDNAVIAGNGTKREGNANVITINGGTFTGNIKSAGYIACGIYAPWKDIITVNGGNFTVHNGIGIVARAGQVTVNGGTFTCTGSAKGGVGDKKFDMDAAQCVYFDASNPAYPAYNSATDYIKLQGGTFSSDVSAYVAKGYVQNNGTVEQLGATNAVAEVGGTYYKTLADAVAAAQDSQTVKMLNDTKVTEEISFSGKKITLDLNGKIIAGVFNDYYSVIEAQGTEATLIVEDNSNGAQGKITSNHYGLTGRDDGSIIVNSGMIETGDGAALSGNNTTGNMNFTVNGGTLTTKSGPAIYQPGQCKLTITGGTLNGGISLRMGQVNISGGTINAATENLDSPAQYYNYSGNAWLPDALYVFGGTYNSTDSTYGNSLNLNITGGTFNCNNGQGSAIAIYDIGKVAQAAKITISGDAKLATTTSNRKAYDVLSLSDIGVTNPDTGYGNKNLVGKVSTAISGGYFTTDPSAYVASGYVAGTSDVSGYSYKVVAKTNTGSVEVKPDVADPEVKVDKIPQKDQETVKAAAETVSAPTLGAAAVDEAQKISEDKANELLKDVNVGDGVKKLYVQSSLKVEPTAYNETTKTLALDITPQYRIVASTAVTADGIELGDNGNAKVVQDYQPMNITKATVVTMELPADFASGVDKLSIQHTKSNGTVEYYTGTVAEQSGKHLLTFTTNGFSPFVISVPAASIGENVYPTLQAAVENVKNNEIIKLAKDVDEATVVTVAKSIKFTVNTDNKTFNAAKNIVAGSNTTVKVTGESSPYTYEFTYTKPSSGSSGGSSSGKTTYKVTTSAVNNGGVNASPSSAEKGATITITLSPDKGYKLDKLTVTDGSGKTVSTVKKSDTVYTFTMPASAVKVGVSYVKATETPSKTKFNDVSANDWFASAVDYVTGKGMMNGTADNTFSPKAHTTRGMVVTVLYRLENQPSTSAASFTDVASGAYYANAVAWANANGIVSGYGSGKFGPNDKVTREQLAAILYRYAQYKKYDVSGAKSLDGYTDAQSVSSYAVPALQWANAAGIVTGKSGSKLDPKGNATRAEVAAMLMRFCENVK